MSDPVAVEEPVPADEVVVETGDKLEKKKKSESGKKESDEIEAMRRKVAELEEETAQMEAAMTSQSKSNDNIVSTPEMDARSVYVGNVDYSVTVEDLQSFFQSCGGINRITIMCDKFTGHPKGYAYVEFGDQDGVANAMLLNESELRGRELKISPKRTNVPGFGLRRRSRHRSRRRRSRRSYFQPY